MADVELIVDVPAHGRRRRGEGLPGSLPEQYSTAANVEQIVDIPARGGLQGFRQGQGSSLGSSRQSSPRVPASVSSYELSAHQMALARESDELADEPGGALDDALADLQRWRRELRRREGGVA